MITTSFSLPWLESIEPISIRFEFEFEFEFEEFDGGGGREVWRRREERRETWEE